MRRVAFPTLVLLTPIFLILLLILKSSDGFFTYTLDDPYIHLALAKNIWHGNYGINALEASAPSSSIIWPFLMAPFAAIPAVFDVAPLIFNVICTALSAGILLALFPAQKRSSAITLVFVLMLSMNLYGLIFNGMEHSLQILLVLYIAYGLINPEFLKKHGRADALFYASVYLLPLVRYEGMAISIPVLAYAFLSGRRKQALITLTLLVGTLAAFSLYLHAKGLGFLPSSVLAKSAHATASTTVQNFLSNVQKYGFMLVPVAIICISKLKTDPAYALMIAGVTALHFALGRHGWYGRYEVYFVIFIVVIALKQLVDSQPKMWWVVFVLPLTFANLVKTTLTTHMASSNIHNQQVQMAEIARLLNEKVAVNDLGLVALRSNNYVLDLAGLGSLEVLKRRVALGNTVDWMSELMVREHIEHAIIYDELFPNRPAHWIKVAELKLLQERITPAADVVSFYSTSESAAVRMRAAVEAFMAAGHQGKFAVTLK